jgi:hypothetical protein
MMPVSTSNGRTAPAFINISSYVAEESPPAQQPTFLAGPPPGASPFLSVYESEEPGDEAEDMDASADEYATFLSELYDEEFDEAVFELVNEAAALYDEHLTTSSMTTRTLDPERFLDTHFEPLVRELERSFDSLRQQFETTSLAGLTEGEIDTIFERYNPAVELSPGFENFFGKIGDALKKVAKKGVDLAKKGAALAAGPLFAQLKALVKPLINRVLRFAIDKIPAPLRPIARRLARRMDLIKKEVEGTDDYADDPEGDISNVQYEFNEQLTELLFAGDDVQRELEVTQVAAESRETYTRPLAELDEARDRFIDELSRLKDGEDPTPIVENFIPVLMPIVTKVVKTLGLRKQLVNFLSPLVAKLISRFVGKKNGEKLSRAMVDAGLGLLNLEVTQQDMQRAANAAIASTVEDTVRRVAAFPDYVLDDQELLETFAVEAFEQAAAANMPPVLTEATYRKRPDLRESSLGPGTWVMHPLRGRPRYKKFCRVLRTRVTPHKARNVESFEGTSLAEFLEDQFGMEPGDDFEADVHLYESIPGTMLPEIARLETNTPGLGTYGEAGYGQMHPLTPDAAATLLGEPGLGRDIESEQTPNRMRIRPGQRFYYLNIPGKKPVLRRDRHRRVRLQRPGGLKVVLDFPKRQIRVGLHVSEKKSQGLMVKLRQKGHASGVLGILRNLLDGGLLTALKRGGRGRLKIIHETVAPEEAFGGALKRIPSMILKRVQSLLREWLLKGLMEFLKKQAPRFVAAAEAPEDGVTVIATISNPPGLDVLRRVLKGRIPSLKSLRMSGGAADVRIDVLPGYVNV